MTTGSQDQLGNQLGWIAELSLFSRVVSFGADADGPHSDGGTDGVSVL